MAKDVATVLTKLGEDVSTKDLFDFGLILLGHSMGAKVALAAISTLPPGMVSSLRGLVLIAPAPPTALLLPPEMREQQAAYSSEKSIRWTVKNVLANTKRLTTSDVELVFRDSLGGHAAAKKTWPGIGMREDASEIVSSALRGCRGLCVSVLVGELDVVEPRERVETEVVSFLTGNGADVKLMTLEGAKHLIPLEDPKSIYQEISRF
jgi:pimeloyl-ACP methyl ester carboxylesterase